LSDGRRDFTVQKDIVNFFANSPKGSVFIRSTNVSNEVKDANFLFKIIDDLVEKVGEENVIQVVIDTACNHVGLVKKNKSLSRLFFLDDLN